MYIDFEVDDGSVTDSMDQLLGSLEMLTIAIVWLAFFPSRFYRSWIERATAWSTAAR